MSDDELTRKHTAFSSMQELLEAPGGYWPTLRTQSARNFGERMELCDLADAYDAYQYSRLDPRRVNRS